MSEKKTRWEGSVLLLEDLLLWLVAGGLLWELLRRTGPVDAIDWVAVVLWALSPAIEVAAERYLLTRQRKSAIARIRQPNAGGRGKGGVHDH